MFLSVLIIFARNWQRSYFLFFRAIFAILILSVWWRFVAILCSKQDVPNDQVNRRFPLLIKFHLIDECLEHLLFILFMYTFYLLPQNGILNIQTDFFLFTWYYDTLQLRFIYFWHFSVYKINLFEVAIQKCLFKTVSYKEYFKGFPNVLFSC